MGRILHEPVKSGAICTCSALREAKILPTISPLSLIAPGPCARGIAARRSNVRSATVRTCSISRPGQAGGRRDHGRVRKARRGRNRRSDSTLDRAGQPTHFPGHGAASAEQSREVADVHPMLHATFPLPSVRSCSWTVPDATVRASSMSWVSASSRSSSRLWSIVRGSSTLATAVSGSSSTGSK